MATKMHLFLTITMAFVFFGACEAQYKCSCDVIPDNTGNCSCCSDVARYTDVPLCSQKEAPLHEVAERRHEAALYADDTQKAREKRSKPEKTPVQKLPGTTNIVVYLLVTSNLCTTILAIVLAVQIWRTRRQRKIKRDRKKGGPLDVIGRPPADLPHDQSPFQGRHGQRRDSFPYGHYQAIRDENVIDPTYSEPLTETMIFRMVMSAVYRELQKTSKRNQAFTTQIIRLKTKMLVEDYLDPVPYIKRKNKIRSSDVEEGFKEEEVVYASAASLSAASMEADYARTLSAEIMHEIQDVLSEMLDSKYNTVPVARNGRKRSTESSSNKGSPKQEGAREEKEALLSTLSVKKKKEDTVYETLP